MSNSLTIAINTNLSSMSDEVSTISSILQKNGLQYTISQQENSSNTIICHSDSNEPVGILRKDIFGSYTIRCPMIGRCESPVERMSNTRRLERCVHILVNAIRPVSHNVAYTVMDDASMATLLSRSTGNITFDTETDGLDAASRIVALGLKIHDRIYIVRSPDLCLTAMLDGDLSFTVCNSTFEHSLFLHRFGRSVNITRDVQVDHCMMFEGVDCGLELMAGLVDMYGYEYSFYHDMMTMNLKHHQMPFQSLAKYCAMDVYVTDKLRTFFTSAISNEPSNKAWECNEWLNRAQYALARMKHNGMEISRTKLLAVIEDKRNSLQIAVDRIRNSTGKDFNISSFDDKYQLIYEHLKLPGKHKTKSGKYSTGKVAIRHILNKHENELLDCLKTASVNKAILDGVLQRCLESPGRIHSNFNLTRLLTGQISSTNPPMQNVAKDDTRTIFVSRFKGGSMLEFDYSQLHLRIIGNLSQCENFIRCYNHDIDIHAKTAADTILQCDISEVISKLKAGDQGMSKIRDQAKRVNFSIIFEIGPRSLSRDIMRPERECGRIIDRFFISNPEIQEHIKRQHAYAKKHGYVVSPMGRVRHLPDAKEPPTFEAQERALRQAGDYQVSNSGRYITLYAMTMVNYILEKYKMRSLLVCQVHDSMVFDVAPGETENIIDIVHKCGIEEINKICDWMKPIPLAIDWKISKHDWGFKQDTMKGTLK